MKFVQLVEFSTDRFDEIEKLAEEWQAATEGKRTARRVTVCEDRDQKGRYITIAEFDSYEDAMKNSNMPETTQFSEQMAKLYTSGPTFRNLDVQREELG